jgi:hypothetical protein
MADTKHHNDNSKITRHLYLSAPEVNSHANLDETNPIKSIFLNHSKYHQRPPIFVYACSPLRSPKEANGKLTDKVEGKGEDDLAKQPDLQAEPGCGIGLEMEGSGDEKAAGRVGGRL